MKSFLMVVGIVFDLIVVARMMRMAVEPAKASDPWFLALTAVAGVLGVWAWVLLGRMRRA